MDSLNFILPCAGFYFLNILLGHWLRARVQTLAYRMISNDRICP